MTENVERLKQEIKQLENSIVELRTELHNTKNLVEKHNQLRETIVDMSERVRALETWIEQEEKGEKTKHKNKEIQQEWIVIFISMVAVLITFINVIWG
ncbi:hypothetical protein [Natranaerobius thermophilus]|uniref:Uncharacterized protein n=1 Tax=Natranaerobius thermophilus (strain ATCC BAA-1301 / DSM 18059 / JW/NM-WN-LF) TaxID=457570 RepID=B2A0W6_NATTJ|nr:hypothetical protein [Natranaerobius thermophilus]ACB85996.1 hypothetical protein Nther_2431 [Natranaerobius thermophilus JW/NM-WN-LF]